MWNRFESSSGYAYTPEHSPQSGEVGLGSLSGKDLSDAESDPSGQQRQSAYADRLTLCSDQIRKGESSSTPLYFAMDVPRAPRSQRSLSRGKLPAAPNAPFQTEYATSFRLEHGPSNVQLGNAPFDLEGVSNLEKRIFNVFYARQNQPINAEDVNNQFGYTITDLPTRISRINKGLLKKDLPTIVLVRECSLTDKEGYVWVGQNAPVERSKFGVLLRRYSLVGEDQKGKYLALGLRTDEYHVLSDLFTQTGLGVPAAMIEDTLKRVHSKESAAAHMVFNLYRRIAPLGLAITNQAGHPPVYKLGKGDGRFLSLRTPLPSSDRS